MQSISVSPLPKIHRHPEILKIYPNILRQNTDRIPRVSIKWEIETETES
jgi:hypothetical protein